jgi:hypothetical protein
VKSRAKKGWSVRDIDHIPAGSRVMLAAAPVDLYPSIAQVAGALGLPGDGHHTRTGIVAHRWYGDGEYMVRIDGSKMEVRVSRADLMFPVPDDIILFVPRARRSA